MWVTFHQSCLPLFFTLSCMLLYTTVLNVSTTIRYVPSSSLRTKWIRNFGEGNVVVLPVYFPSLISIVLISPLLSFFCQHTLLKIEIFGSINAMMVAFSLLYNSVFPVKWIACSSNNKKQKTRLLSI